MNEEREAEAGAPIEESGASVADVQAAVDRAGEVGSVNDANQAAGEAVAEAQNADQTVAAEGQSVPAAETVAFAQPEHPAVAFAEELPSAGAAPTMQQPEMPTMAAPTMAAPTMVAPTMPAYQQPGYQPGMMPARDGEIRISADHPMAALYMQSPMPPETRGNRGAGALIALVATLGFVAILTAVMAIMLAPQLPPSQFMNGITDVIISWQMLFGALAFLVGMLILVGLFGKSGWWAYLLGGIFVAVLAGFGTIIGAIIDFGGLDGFKQVRFSDFMKSVFSPSFLVAFIAARESSIWFGAWIGSRGRRVKQQNADALTEYEAALAEAQAPQS